MMLIKKLREKVSNLVKLSLFYRAYKYELAYNLNKQNQFLTFHCLLWSVQNLKFNVMFATKHYSSSTLWWLLFSNIMCCIFQTLQRKLFNRKCKANTMSEKWYTVACKINTLENNQYIIKGNCLTFNFPFLVFFSKPQIFGYLRDDQ